MVLSSPSASVTPEERVRILIADRNRLSTNLLAESLGHDGRFDIITSAGEEVPAACSSGKPDVALISAEFDSGAKTGLQVVRAVHSRQPRVEIVVLVDVSARDSILAAFRCGAKGVFCRTEPPSELRACVERVRRGEIWAGRREADYLLASLRSSPSCDGIDDDKVSILSKRELEVAECAAQGRSNKQIADELHLSEHTVKNYLFRIFDKMNVSNRFELLFVLYNARDGLGRGGPERSSRQENYLQSCLRAAEAGFAAAQFSVGLAYLQGNEVESSPGSAYYWLRRAEESSAVLQERCHRLLDEARHQLTPAEVAALEAHLERAAKGTGEVDERHSLASIQQQLRLLA